MRKTNHTAPRQVRAGERTTVPLARLGLRAAGIALAL